MPVIQFTNRYRSDAEYAKTDYALHKKAQRKHIKETYPGAKVFKQVVITDGIPDFVRFGDLRSKNEIAIRADVEVSEQQANELRKKLK